MSTRPFTDLPETILSPKFHDQTIVRIELRCEFEPHGRASETWEWCWHLWLEKQQAHWTDIHGNKKPRRLGVVEHFKGKTLDDVVKLANEFLADVPWHSNVIAEVRKEEE